VCVIVRVWLLLLVSASKFHVMASTLEQFGLYLDEEKCVFNLVRDGQFATSWLFNFYLKPENSSIYQKFFSVKCVYQTFKSTQLLHGSVSSLL
jgi:hypothetical protein